MRVRWTAPDLLTNVDKPWSDLTTSPVLTVILVKNVSTSMRYAKPDSFRARVRSLAPELSSLSHARTLASQIGGSHIKPTLTAPIPAALGCIAACHSMCRKSPHKVYWDGQSTVRGACARLTAHAGLVLKPQLLKLIARLSQASHRRHCGRGFCDVVIFSLPACLDATSRQPPTWRKQVAQCS